MKQALVFVAAAVACSSGCASAFVLPAGGAVRATRLHQMPFPKIQFSLRLPGRATAGGGSQSFRSALHMVLEDDENMAVSPGGFNLSGDAPFEIRGFSLANAALAVGILITVASFAEYFSSGGGGGLSGIGFIYGIPVSLVGLALKYAELAPAPLQTTPESEELFERKATETMRKIKQDVTRHRYGDEAHLDTTVKALGLVMPQKDYPQLQYISQSEAPNGELEFSMVFQSLETPFKRWAEADRVKKYKAFFGPGVDAEVVKVSAADRMVAIKLTTLPEGAEAAAAEEAEAPKAPETPAAPEAEEAAAEAEEAPAEAA